MAQANSLAGELGGALQRAGKGVRAFVGGESDEPRKAKLLLVHVIDEAEDGCEFDEFFTMTPPDLLQMGQIFRTPAVPLFRSRHARLPLSGGRSRATCSLLCSRPTDDCQSYMYHPS